MAMTPIARMLIPTYISILELPPLSDIGGFGDAFIIVGSGGIIGGGIIGVNRLLKSFALNGCNGFMFENFKV